MYTKKELLKKLSDIIDYPPFIVFVLIIIGLLPIIVFMILWFWLDPVGFWQKGAMIALFGFVFLPAEGFTAVFAWWGLDSLYDDIQNKKKFIKK